ncbi:MAG: hypothetical protein HQL63_14505 [Magnetococcales bacterium]|nr:hypothetical protein [Magnetococcales bacterium]MBF0322811.1 hypothetical protein [Magnetococcales bacterium]
MQKLHGVVECVLTTYQGGEGSLAHSDNLKLDKTSFLFCLRFAEQRMVAISDPQCAKLAGGHANWPYSDGMIIFGAHLATAMARFRPLRYSDPPSVDRRADIIDEQILFHINDIFALECGWVVGRWFLRHKDPGYVAGQNQLANENDRITAEQKAIYFDVMSLRTWRKKAQNMFQYMATEGADVATLVFFYDGLLSLR